MNDELNIVISAMLDEKSIENINSQIDNISKQLKPLSFSFAEGDFNNSLSDILNNFIKATDKISSNWSKALEGMGKKVDEVNKKVGDIGKNENKSIDSKTGLQNTLDKTILAYKEGLIEIEDYIEKLSSLMYKDDSSYTENFDNLPEKKRIEYIDKLTKALDDVSKSDDKALISLNNQKIKIEELASVYEKFKTQYSSSKFYDEGQSNDIATQIEGLKTLDPLTAQYSVSLATVSSQMKLYQQSVKDAISEDDKLAKALNDKELAIKRVNDKIQSLEGNKFVNSDQINRVKQMTSGLGGMTAGSTQLRNALKNTTYEVNSLVQKANSLNTLSTGLKTIGQLFMIASPVMLANKVLREMVSTVNELNKSMTDIRVVTGMSYDSVIKLRDGYNELGKSIGATTKQVMDSAIEFIRQGRSVADTNTLVQASVMGAKLAGIETASMTEYLTSAVNGYKVEAKEATSVIDKLIAVDNSAATSMSELSTAMARTANSAKMAGVDMDALLGYIGTISSVTRRSAETIGESMKTIFARYSNIKLGQFVDDGTVASDVRKALGAVNIELMATEDTFRDFSDVIDELSGKWGVLTAVERSAVATAVAGVRQRENFLVLMENMSMATDLTSKSLESNGLAIDRYGIYLGSTESKLNTLKATLEGVFNKTLGSDSLHLLIEAGTHILQITENLGGLVPVVGGLGLAIASIKKVGGAKCCSLIVRRHQYISYAKYKFRYWTVA